MRRYRHDEEIIEVSGIRYIHHEPEVIPEKGGYDVEVEEIGVKIPVRHRTWSRLVDLGYLSEEMKRQIYALNSMIESEEIIKKFDTLSPDRQKEIVKLTNGSNYPGDTFGHEIYKEMGIDYISGYTYEEIDAIKENKNV